MTSTVPMHVWWGRDRTRIYNDASIGLLGAVEQHVDPLVDEVFRTGEARSSQPIATFVPNVQEPVYITCSLSPVVGTSGIEGVFGAFSPATDATRATQHLRTPFAFLGNVSQELRTQLSLMLDPLEQVLRGELSAPARVQLELAHRSSLRLRNLVGAALDLTEAVPELLDYELLDLGELTRDVASTFRSAFEVAGLQLIVDCTSEWIAVDRAMIEQVISKLLADALALCVHSEIVVRLRSSEQGVRLEIAGGTRDVRDPIVAELVARHGGSLHVQHDGTQCVVELPRGPIGTARVATRWPAPIAPERVARVLVVDDNRDMREYLCHLLDDQFVVDVAPDGIDALAVMRYAAPDIVVADVMMPRLDGVDLVRRIRHDPQLRHTPIVLVSGRTNSQQRIDALAAGADDFLVKPFSSGELRARIDGHLKLARARIAAGQAATANLAKDEVFAVLGHELRNPLAPLLTMVQLLQLKSPTPELERIERQVRHLGRLVDDLLDISRLTRGKVSLEPQTVMLDTVLQRALDETRSAWEPRQQRIVVDVPVTELSVDPYRIAQVLGHLIRNASNASGDNATIRVTGQCSATHVTIHVIDQGKGIAREQLDAIFEPFVQAPQDLARARGGLGLGLAISRNLVQLHGGLLSARSAGIGLGSDFVISIPLRYKDLNQ